MNFIFLNKKGQTKPLEEMVVLVVAALIIVGIFIFFNRLWAAFNSQKDDGSTANFDRLYNDIKQLLESSDTVGYKLDEYYIGSGKILMAFDTKWDDQKNSVVEKLLNSNAYKPFKCGNSACICLYTSGWKPSNSAQRDTGVVSCRSEAFANKDIAFLSEGGNVKPKTSGAARTENGNYLVFYGSQWKLQSIYIEKFYSVDKIYFYISKIDTANENDPANIRKKSIDNSKKQPK